MNEVQSEIYKSHHKARREPGFSILKSERGELVASLIGENKKVLDIGCRDGALTRYFSSHNEVTGVDIDDRALELTKQAGIETIKMDLNGDWQALSGRKFEVVVAGEVLEHLYYPDQVIEKIAGLLDQGQIFLGSVPNAFSLKNRFRYFRGKKRHTPLDDPTHINHFHIDELRLFLSRYFSEVKILGLGRYARLARLFPSFFAFDLFFICRK